MFALEFFGYVRRLQRVRGKPSRRGVRRYIRRRPEMRRRPMHRRPLKPALALLCALALALAVPAGATEKKQVTITGNDDASYAFNPGTVHISKGSTVHWNWNSNAPHNVTFTKT